MNTDTNNIENWENEIINRFLGWKLPENFNPDGGISFKRDFNEHTAYPMKNEPTGTNLFDAMQAREMVRYILGDTIDSLLIHAKLDTIEKIRKVIEGKKKEVDNLHYELFGEVTYPQI